MPYLITKTDQEKLLDAAQALTGSEGWKKDAVAFGAKKDRESDIVAVGVFQNFSAGGAEFHFATIGKRMQRGVIKAYLFTAFHPKGLGLRKLYAHIAHDNAAAQRAALGVGFRFQYLKPDGMANGGDMVVLKLDAETRQPA
jgi:RimJ/RimL family protein N-acetyltransferase